VSVRQRISPRCDDGTAEGHAIQEVAHATVVIACCIDREAMGNTLVRYRELMEAQALVGTPLTDDPTLIEASAKRRSGMDPATIRAYLTLNAAIAIEHIVLRAADWGRGVAGS
jgi:hypothetical protein